jgi:small nuclear ribonucleoprotein (snRNP)-like protein
MIGAFLSSPFFTSQASVKYRNTVWLLVMSGRAPTPWDFLRLLIERKVKVQILEDREIVGVMQGYDEHSNLVLSNLVETLLIRGADGQVARHSRSLDLLFIRGDRVITVSPC